MKAPKKPIEDILAPGELVRFLRRLSAMYDDRKFGNRPLSRALTQLAGRLEAEESSRRPSTKHPAVGDENRALSPTALARLGPAEVEQMLNDERLTKASLVMLGAYRFSIPSAALEKRPIADVREAVRSALLHEQSLGIITEEAMRQGASRRS